MAPTKPIQISKVVAQQIVRTDPKMDTFRYVASHLIILPTDKRKDTHKRSFTLSSARRR